MGLQTWVVVAVLASGAGCAPQSTHPVYAAVHSQSGGGPTGEYMALLSDLEHPAATNGHDYNDEVDTYGSANLFPVHRVVIATAAAAAASDLPTTYVPLVLAPQEPHPPPTPRQHLVLVTDHSNPPSTTRLAKSFEEMSGGATPILPAMPVQYKNRNPFINEEMQSGRSMAAADSSTTEALPSASSTTEAPPMLEEKMAVEEETSKSTEETNESTPSVVAPTELADVVEGGTHPIPPWIPDEKQEELDSEEQEREHEQIDRITNALVEEESVDEGEAITRGRMQPNEGLGTPSIIAIVVAFVGVIGMAGAAAGFILYKRSLVNKPQTLNDKMSNPDYSSYIDDTLRVSAGKSRSNEAGKGGSRCRQSAGGMVNRGFVSPPYLKDNSEEMYSLDNDSFLNSLEAMTIQNFWTENVKHTKL
ncbi:uncharacterized protein LOC135942241 isoform X2 [Cloeon dipterum]|uniref:uncharacterized protein LOC135942241 isoform X2 n=1 Tax=Cloeon dipterum TaxID=197152 RepID=UPI0032201020